MAVLTSFVGIYIHLLMKRIPKNIYIEQNKETTIAWNLPVTGENVVQTVNFQKPVTFIAQETGTYAMNLKLFGIFSVPSMQVNVVEQKNVYPCGFPVGLYMKTDGVMVVETEEIELYDGGCCAPCEDILKPGDYIVQINGKQVDTKEKLQSLVADSQGEEITIVYNRAGKLQETKVCPAKDTEGIYRIGAWIKDDAQGIGTLTYIDEQRQFGALGHGITDNQTGKLLDMKIGALYETKILSIVKGKNGTPGEFVGSIDYQPVHFLGTILRNTENGIGGIFTQEEFARLCEAQNMELMPVGYSYEVHKGEAVIRMCIEGVEKDYPIQIRELTTHANKNMTFEVVSEELINQTNGIVQGMSGCPIIQDGKVVGAVTHVFVEDPHCGYGIFLENMM